MNPLLAKLQPYPFERLRQLFAGVTPNPAFAPISLGIGEPKHPTPAFIQDALAAGMGALATYPATAGDLPLRQSFTGWLERRYGLALEIHQQLLAALSFHGAPACSRSRAPGRGPAASADRPASA